MAQGQEASVKDGDGRGSFFRAAGVIGAATVASRILGLAREVAFAAIFGANWVTDAFRIAFVIPYVLRRLLGEGAMSAFVVPVFTEQLELEGRDGAFRFMQSLYTLFFAVVAVLVILGIFAMPGVVAVIAPGFVKEAATFDLTLRLARIMLPYMLFMMTSALAMGILNSFYKFAVPACAPVVMNVFALASLFILVPLWGDTPEEQIYALTVGVLAGGAAQVLIQVPSLYRLGFRFRPRFNLRHPALKKVGLLMVPALFSIGVVRINLLINTAAASLVGVGVVSFIMYAERLLQFPMGVFGFSLANALLPRISRHAARGEMETFKDLVSFALRASLFISLPATVGLVILGEPLVRVIYERGAFTAADSASTAVILGAFALGLFAFVGMQIITPAFYALKLPREPIRGGVVALVSNLVFTVILALLIGGPGIALAISISTTCSLAYLIYRFRRAVGPIGFRRIAAAGLRFGGASVLLAALLVPARLALEYYVPAGTLPQAAALLAAIAAAVPAYVLLARLFRAPEVPEVIRIILRRK
ncbi:MAG: murein biosynthesis integral membrane protein MurJ [Candidatus Zixiibacteriota bacterium]